MRFVKLAESELETLDDVQRFFRAVIPRRQPPGKFRVTPARIAQDGLECDEPLLFTYHARVVFTARAGSGLVRNDDEERERYSHYFVVDLATLCEADEDL